MISGKVDDTKNCVWLIPVTDLQIVPARKPRERRRSFRCAGDDEDSAMRFGRANFHMANARAFAAYLFPTQTPTIDFAELPRSAYGLYRPCSPAKITLSFAIEKDNCQCWQTVIHELAHHVEYNHGNKFNHTVLAIYEKWWVWAVAGNIIFPAPRNMRRETK